VICASLYIHLSDSLSHCSVTTCIVGHTPTVLYLSIVIHMLIKLMRCLKALTLRHQGMSLHEIRWYWA
jgi:hypothetical protein